MTATDPAVEDQDSFGFDKPVLLKQNLAPSGFLHLQGRLR